MKHRAVISLLTFTLILIALFFCHKAFARQEIHIKDDILKYTLPNGLVVILKQDSRTPTFSAHMYVRAGSSTEGKYSGSGITHLIEHMIFKGTASRSAQDIAKQARALGADIGAYTTLDYTAFKMQGPSENILSLLEILNDITANSQFTQEELDREKSVIKEEMRYINDNPQKFLSQKFWQTAYIIHPYRDPIIGYPDVFDNITRDDIMDYYAKFYVPNNMVLVIVGCMDKEIIRKAVDESFGILKRRPFQVKPAVTEPLQMALRNDVSEYRISKTLMLMGFHSVGLADKDVFALDTLAVILGTGRTSALYDRMHNQQNLAYNIDAYNYTPFNPGLFLIGLTLEPGNEDKAVDEVFATLDVLKKSPIKRKDLDKAKNQLISSYVMGRQSQSAQAADFGVSQLLTGDIDFSRYYLDGIKAVTSDDIINAMNTYIRQDRATIVRLIPVAASAQGPDDEGLLRNTSRIISKNTLKNNLRLVVCEDKSLPIVSVQVCCKGGLYAENTLNNGISNLTSQMLLKGTAGRSEEEIFYLVESIGGRLSSYSGNNSFGLSLEVMSDDYVKGIDILADVLLRPVFPKDKLAVLKKDILAQIELADNDIFTVTEKELRAALFKNSPYSMTGLGTADSIDTITRKDIIQFYREHSQGSNMVISVCGDVDKDKVSSLIESRLRGIGNKNFPKPETPKSAQLGGRIDVTNIMDKEQAVVMAGFKTPGVTCKERYPLQILSSIFQGSGGRLFENIRQDKGLAYTLGVFGMAGMDEGSFIFYAAVSPDNVETVTEKIMNEINSVNSGNITADDITAAKKSLISQYHTGLQTAGEFAQKTALDELYGLGYDNYLSYPETIQSITLNEVISLSNKYLNPALCVVSKTIPKEQGD